MSKKLVRRPFTQEDIDQIRAARAAGADWATLAKRFNRYKTSMYQAVKRGTPTWARYEGKGVSPKLQAAKAALRRVNGTGPRVPLVVMVGDKDRRSFTSAEAATRFLVTCRMAGRDARLYREIPYEITAELKGRVE